MEKLTSGEMHKDIIHRVTNVRRASAQNWSQAELRECIGEAGNHGLVPKNHK